MKGEFEKRIDSFNLFLERLKRSFKPGEDQELINHYNLLHNRADFIYLYNYHSGQLMFSKGLQKLTGLSGNNIEIIDIYKLIHPEDISDVLLYTRASLSVSLNIKTKEEADGHFTVDFRLKKPNGRYARILRQSSALEVSRKDGLISTISLCTDISNIKMNGPVVSMYTGTRKKQYEELLEIEKRDMSENLSTSKLSQREKEILDLISQGKKSIDISNQLNISIHTLHTHRRNMLKRYGAKSITELLIKMVINK